MLLTFTLNQHNQLVGTENVIELAKSYNVKKMILQSVFINVDNSNFTLSTDQDITLFCHISDGIVLDHNGYFSHLNTGTHTYLNTFPIGFVRLDNSTYSATNLNLLVGKNFTLGSEIEFNIGDIQSSEETAELVTTEIDYTSVIDGSVTLTFEIITDSHIFNEI